MQGWIKMRKEMKDKPNNKKGKRIMKVIGFIFAVLILGVVILAVGAWSMFGANLKAAQSVQKLEDGLYTMEYVGDYGFDEFLKQGGASSDAKMAEYITSFLSHGFWKPEANEVEKKFGCSALTVTSPTGEMLMGRNFDWQGKRPNTMIVHTKPKNGYESVSTCNLEFLGFGEGWKPEGMPNQYMALAAIYVPLDGLNEKGLCVADLINGDQEATHQDTEKPDLTVVSAIRLLLDKAATVDEAVALLEQYDMNSSIGTSHHLAISDATGKSVVVEYVNNEMIVTQTAVVTNHYLSAGEKYGVGNEKSHLRFETLSKMKSDTEGIMTAEELKGCMEKVSYPDITQWSIVYDKKNLKIDYYWQRNYEKSFSFELH